MDNSDFMLQVVDLQSLEQTAQLTDSLSTFQSFIEMSSGSSLIGRVVKGLTTNGHVVEGVVDRVVMAGGEVSLIVGSETVPLRAVHEVSAAEQAAGVTV